MKRNKIIVLQGPPASGKSTWARETAKVGTPYVIVSRDAIRESRGEYWIPNQEDYISDIEEFAIRSAIKRNLIPIIDATNLNPKTIQKWETLAKELDCDIEFQKFYIPYKEALERDSNRNRPVGKKVLERFYKTYFYEQFISEVGYDSRLIKVNNGFPNCVVFDLDGTVALHKGRLPFDWDKIPTDSFDSRMYDIIQQFNLQAIKIIFLTGRPETARSLTDEWLKKNIPGINYTLLMRSASDFRSGEVVKSEIWENEVASKYNTLCVFEDSNKCVDMWRELGILTCQVANGDY